MNGRLEKSGIQRPVWFALIVLVLGIVLSTPVTALEWQSEILNESDTQYFDAPALELDRSDNPHIFFTYNYCPDPSGSWYPYAKYGYKDGSGWHFKDFGSGYNGPIALDSYNYPHLIYWGDGGTAYRQKYTFWDGSSWRTQNLYSELGDVVTPISSCGLEVDSNNKIHSVYQNRNGPLRYTTTNETGWFNHTLVETLNSWHGSGGYYAALALDSANRPHILYTYSYWDGTVSRHPVIYTFKDESGWHQEQIDDLYSWGKGGIAIDSAGYPHVVYRDQSTSSFRYAFKDGSGWQIEQFTYPDSNALWLSLVLDSENNPHLTCQGDDGTGYKNLKYAYKDTSGWHFDPIEKAYDAYPCLDLDSANIPHIVSAIDLGYSTGPYVLKYYSGIPNEPPVALGDTYTTPQDTPLTVAAPGVLGNDNDPEGDSLTAILVGAPTQGTLALNTDGSFTYTPNTGLTGTDTFTYKANDGFSDSNVATVTITVNPVNKPPTAQDDAYGMDEGKTLTVAAPGVLENDNDPDGDALTAVLVGESSYGDATLSADGSFTYTPDSGFSGTDTFTYKASDGSLDSAVVTVTITVNLINEVPTASDDTYATEEGVVLSVAVPGVLENDDDPDGDKLSAVLAEDVSSGTLTLNADGSFAYTPNENFAGTDTFTYRASDGELESGVTTVTITVNAANHPPVASDDACTLEQDTTHTESAPGVLANDDDPDGDGLTTVLENGVSHGSLTLNADGSFIYTPNTGWSGTDTLTYKAFDGELYSDAATVTLTVTEAANNPPEITAVTAPTDPRLPGSTISITGTFTDPDADDTHTAEWDWGDGATNEGAVDETAGTITGSHTYTAPGTYTVTLTVTDSEGASDIGTTTITVQTPVEATADLISRVESLSLPGGIENGLTTKLEHAIAALNSGDEKAAANDLNAFINQVKAQRGKKIPAGEADALIALAQMIIGSI